MTELTAPHFAEHAGLGLVKDVDWIVRNGNPHVSEDPRKPKWVNLVVFLEFGIISRSDGTKDSGGNPTPFAFEIHKELVRLGRCEPTDQSTPS